MCVCVYVVGLAGIAEQTTPSVRHHQARQLLHQHRRWPSAHLGISFTPSVQVPLLTSTLVY